MTETNGKKTLGVLLVGDKQQAFTRDCLQKLNRRGIDCILCRDIYDAFGKLLTRSSREPMLVIGRIGELCSRNSRFFEKASSQGAACCCLADRPLRGKDLYSMTHCEGNIFVIGHIEEVEEVILKTSALKKTQTDERVTFTEKEINALLGG